MRRRRNRFGQRTRVDLLTLALVLAAGACVGAGMTDAMDVAAVFAPQDAGTTQTATLLLPQQQWYLLYEGGQAVAACATLLEAEIAREQRNVALEIESVNADALELRVTAEKSRLDALQEAANVVERTLSALRAMEVLEPQERTQYAQLRQAELRTDCRTIGARLEGVENPVAMGLAGLANACLAAMEDLAESAQDQELNAARATLVQQYVSYAAYVEAQGGGEQEAS